MTDFWAATLNDLIVCGGACVSMCGGLLVMRWIDGKLSPLFEVVAVVVGRRIGGKLGAWLVRGVYERLACEADYDLLVLVCRYRRS